MAFFLTCCEGKTGRDRLFLSDKGKVWKRQHSNLFRRAVTRSGLPRTFVFHGLRHTYASELVRAGVPLEIIAKQLGHSDTRAVVHTYGHLAEHYREQQIREKFRTLGAAFRQIAHEKAEDLATLWTSVHVGDWREYASVEQSSTTPLKSFAPTCREVIEVFQLAENNDLTKPSG